MKIAYISYWGINDGLTQSTVFPHLEMLQLHEKVTNVYFFTFERADFVLDNRFSKIIHVPIMEHKNPPGINKFLSFRTGWKEVQKTVQNNDIKLIICRSVFAGILGYLTYKKYKIPFVVESYEPHVDYMEESGEWKPSGIKSRIINYYDRKIRASAFKLYPVSFNFKAKLINANIQIDKIEVIPCSVPINAFKYDKTIRNSLRVALGIPSDSLVGIYVGKFGGIYLDNEAILLFKSFFNTIASFNLIVLTPQDNAELYSTFKKSSLPIDRIYIKKVAHSDVPSYLSASDFAMSLQKFTPSNAFLNPIKIGEYWANGLPVLITKGVGDDEQIVSVNNIGIVYDVANDTPTQVAVALNSFMNSFDRNDQIQRDNIVAIAEKHRSFEINKKVYDELINSI